MPAIIITAYGTMGDILPYLALGQALTARGHKIYMSIPKHLHSKCLEENLIPIQIGHKEVNAEKVNKSALLWDNWSTNVDELEARKKLPGSHTWFNTQKSVNNLLNVCSGATLIICNPQQEIVAAVIAEKLSIPLVRAIVTPALLYQPNNWWKVSQWSIKKNIYHDNYHKLRETQGLTGQDPWRKYWGFDRLIFPASPYLFPSPPYCLPSNQTGFWFYNSSQLNKWRPDDKLRKFMTTDEKPLVVSFSSQPIRDRENFIITHVRAAMKIGRRILIQEGWSNFNSSHLPDNIDKDSVMFTGFIPQDWLFSQASAVITHGGVGTITRALRNGCTMLLEPHTYEQCFNAHRTLSWGVGAAMYPNKLTAEGIANVLEKKVLSDGYKKQAIKIKTQLHSEAGVEKASDLIEAWLPS